ncbi:acyl-CoA thioesterase [Pseudonocardia acaciae]|uniref:acyl-CoA thioesterase n=1 Tax=Pseudonocardia acaciae TaxID=551276 RepID=UPI000A055353|nr:thioesterase family protein [Pseudonocardia acaciae]
MTALPASASSGTDTSAEPEVFLFPITVRYMEVDGQGVVFNGWYLTYFDEAMTAFFAHRGLTYQTMQASGYEVQTVRTEINYRAGVRWADPIVVAVSPSRYGRTSFALDFQVRRGTGQDTEVTTEGRITYVVVNTADHTKREIPPPMRAALGEAHPLH